MSRFIAREKLASYERLEWGSLKKAKELPQPISTATGEVPLQVRALDLEQLQQVAIEEASSEGYAQGSAQIKIEIQKIHQMMAQGQLAWRQLHQDAAEQVLDLALELSQHILRQHIEVNRESILPVVSEAIDTLADNGSHAHLILHPDDAALVRTHLAEDLQQGQWKIVEDARIQRGGCRVTTNHGEVDASIDTCWERAVAVLERKLPWHRAEPTMPAPAAEPSDET